MKIKIIQVGKTKEAAYREIEEEFLKRLRSFCDLETVTVKTSDQKEENEQLREKIPRDHTIVALDVKGKAMSSEEFAEFLRVQRDHEGGKVVFLVGGPHGFTEETLAQANVKLSFSKMTFTHQMVRLFLLEQLYRGFTILGGKSYHY